MMVGCEEILTPHTLINGILLFITPPLLANIYGGNSGPIMISYETIYSQIKYGLNYVRSKSFAWQKSEKSLILCPDKKTVTATSIYILLLIEVF